VKIPLLAICYEHGLGSGGSGSVALLDFQTWYKYSR